MMVIANLPDGVPIDLSILKSTSHTTIRQTGFYYSVNMTIEVQRGNAVLKLKPCMVEDLIFFNVFHE